MKSDGPTTSPGVTIAERISVLHEEVVRLKQAEDIIRALRQDKESEARSLIIFEAPQR